MKNDNRTHQISRRKLLKASGASVVSASIGFPAILSAQSKSVKIGFWGGFGPILDLDPNSA